MTFAEYEMLQAKLDNKLNSKDNYGRAKKAEYYEGVEDCKAFVTEVFGRTQRHEPMTRAEYEMFQAQFDKLNSKHVQGMNKEEAHRNGVLACKSMLKNVFEQSQKQSEE